VEDINTPFAFGIEDQEGCRGLGGYLNGWKLLLFNQHSYWFRQQWESPNYFISKLRLTFNDACPQTKFYIRREPQFLRGFNVRHLGAGQPDIDKRYSVALRGAKALLAKIGGVIVDIMLIGIDLVDILAENLYSDMEYTDLRDQFGENPIPSGAYITVPTPCINVLSKGCVVDASIGVYVHWILTDTNNMEHLLTVTATLEYYEVDWRGYPTGNIFALTTLANVKVTTDSPDKANNNCFENATQIQEGTYEWLYADQKWDKFDFYKVYVPFLKSITAKIDVDSDDDFNLYLYNATLYLISSSENGMGQSEMVYGDQWKYPGDWWYIEVRAVWEYGFYNLTVSFGPAGGGGPSEPCPTLFVWNGTAYVDYGVIDIHNPFGEDVIHEVYVLKRDVAVSRYMAHFMLREGWPGLNFSESLIDQVKLYAIINGDRYPCLLINATHSTQGNVWPELILSDEKKTQILLLETINLTFTVLYPTSQIEGYVFVIEGCNMLKA
jgi:hypothetical protein